MQTITKGRYTAHIRPQGTDFHVIVTREGERVMHISDAVANTLAATGWTARPMVSDGWQKRIADYAPAGTVSNGARVVTLTICPFGRWLGRVDGWGKVEREIDLRDYADRPGDAIAAALA